MNGLNKALKQVKNFHKAFNHPVSDSIQMLLKERCLNRSDWCHEEVNEFVDAETIVGQLDANLDLIYFALGNLVEMGFEDIQKYFDIVQNCNMSKLWEDGKPHYREDGKIIKPKGWKPPEERLEAELRKEILCRQRMLRKKKEMNLFGEMVLNSLMKFFQILQRKTIGKLIS